MTVDTAPTMERSCATRYSVCIPTANSEPIRAVGLVKYSARYEYILYGSFYCRSLKTLNPIDNLRAFFTRLSEKSLDYALGDIQGGAFSLVILDRKERTLLLISDRYGLIPLYFSSKSGIACNEISFSFFLDTWKDLPADPVSIFEFIHYGCLFFSDSLNLGLNRLKGGQYVVIASAGVVAHQNWWSRNVVGEQEESVLNELIARVDEAFQSFFCKVPINMGAIAGLSGGFDSRLIVAYLAENNVRPLQTFTMGAPPSEEATSAEAVARLLGAAHFLRQVPVDLIATDGVRVSRSFHLNASLEVAHVDFLRSLVIDALESAPNASYFDGFLGDVVMGGTYFSGAEQSILGILRDISAAKYKVTRLSSIESYVEIALNAKQRVEDPLLSEFMDLDKYSPTLSYRVLQAIAPMYEIARSHQDMVNLMRLSQRGYRYIMTGPQALLPIVQVYLPFMDYGVRDALDKVPLSLLARHKFYRAFLRARFPSISRIPKALNGASARSSESVFRLRQYASGFMRHIIYPWIYRLSAGKFDMKPEYASMQNYLNCPSNGTWITEIAKQHLVASAIRRFDQLKPAVKLRIISLWLSGYSIT